jgi:iron complex outermembrane receptor protein
MNAIRQLLRILACFAALVSTVHAQRTDENVTAQADDAFGRSVGNESIGIYNPFEVRGFSPVDAGNVRIEGLYFDRLTDPNSTLVAGSAIRVGIAAQRYPFPSPTGIVDYDLRSVGADRVVSAVATYGPYGGAGLEIDAQLPLVRDRFGLGAGVGVFRDAFEWGGDHDAISFALIPRWQITPGIELRPFVSGIFFDDEEAQSLLLTTDEQLPPQIPRNRYYGQSWADNQCAAFNYGLLGRGRFGAWTTRLGIFSSVFSPDQEAADLFTDVGANGIANELVIVFPHARAASTSGELRAERGFGSDAYRQRMLFTVRAREQKRRYGGEDVIDVGAVQLGSRRAIPEPAFTFGAHSHDEIRQTTFGAAYDLRVHERAELTVGLQKTSYSKATDTPADGALPRSTDDPLLESATGTFHATSRVAVYAGYTEGLEESPVAPDTAINRNAAAPALETAQYDAGVRITLPANLKLVAGVFNVEKPYFDIDQNRIFGRLGTVQHRGFEFSLAGTPIENLTLVAGTRLLDARVSGPTVDAGLIGRRPVRSSKTYSILSVDYAIPNSPYSVDTLVESISAQVANTANTVHVPGRTVLHFGGRYRWTAFGKPFTVRAQVSNIFNRYGWQVINSGVYAYNQPRRFTVTVAADF